MKVLAVSALYNDINAINSLVDSITRQSRKPEGILIVDNSELDEFLPSSIEGSSIFIYRPGVNVGWSGTYKYAFDYAIREGYELVWFLDQDSEPETACLENLLITYKKLEEMNIDIGIVAPLSIDLSSMIAVQPAVIKKTRFSVMFDGQTTYKNIGDGKILEAGLPITSGSLMRVELADIATQGIEGMIVDAVDWIVAHNVLRAGKRNFISAYSLMFHKMGSPRTHKFLGRSVFLYYSQKRAFLQAKNQSYALGYIDGATARGYVHIFYLIYRFARYVYLLRYKEGEKSYSFSSMLNNMRAIWRAYGHGKQKYYQQ